MTNKETTIEDLARMVNEGFKNTATKNDIKELKSQMVTKDDIESIDVRLNSVDRRLARVETDISEIRKTYVNPHQFEDLMSRVKYLEIKLGVESGK